MPAQEHFHEEQPEAAHIEASDAPLSPHPTSDAEEDVQALPESPSPAKDSHDIESLVNMLESGMPAPLKLSVTDDVAAEIPDEE